MADLDPSTSNRSTDAERIAELEIRVQALEDAMAEARTAALQALDAMPPMVRKTVGKLMGVASGD